MERGDEDVLAGDDDAQGVLGDLEAPRAWVGTPWAATSSTTRGANQVVL
jgi:hypothetical protein